MTKDFPIEECAATAQKCIDEGGTVHQKYTCEKCGERQTMVEPNTFYQTGECCLCGHVTNIKAKGCNYLVLLPTSKVRPTAH